MNKKSKNKKTLAIVAVVLALILVGGFAYAAITGTLFFTGTGTLRGSGTGPGDVQLQFSHVDPEATRFYAKSEASGTARIEAIDGVPGQRIVIDVSFPHLNVEGNSSVLEEVLFHFKVRNTGSVPVKLTGSDDNITSSDPDYYLEIGHGFDIGQIIQPGEVYERFGTSATYISLRVNQHSNPKVDPSEDVTFTFSTTLEYEAVD